MGLMYSRIAIVTGASRQKGIGAAICRKLAQTGIDIFFTHWGIFDSTMPWGVEEDMPANLQRELQGMGVRCEHMGADLASIETPQLILDTVESKLGSPSILVNNAVHDDFNAPFDQLDAATLDRYYAVNM